MDDNAFTLKGKTILITGASSGIGKSIAIISSQLGARLIITGRNKTNLNSTFCELTSNNHLQIIADLTKENDVNDLICQLPKLDGVVHCAGIGDRTLCKHIVGDDLDRVFSSNVYAPILLQSSLLSHKLINKAASIVFIASMAAKHPSIGNAIYSASKGAIMSYSKCLGLELSSKLVRVNCICPAMVWTNLISNESIDRQTLENAQAQYPLKRFGKPEDVSYLCAYMLSDASSWMTGSCVEINGGGEGSLI